MGYKMHKDLRAKSVSYGKTRKASTIKYIVIHFTGNKTDKAKSNANYFAKTNTRQAGAHYFVDDHDVYESINPLKIAYAVGGSKYSDCKKTGGGTKYKIITNTNSISIEMCSTNGKISDKTYKNTVLLTKSLMKKYAISENNVYRHFDVNGKHCPGWKGWIGSTDSIWKQFKKDVSSTKSSRSTAKRTGVVNVKTSLNVRTNPGTNFKLVDVDKPLTNGTEIEILDVKTAADASVWYEIEWCGEKGYVAAKYVKLK